jgi:nitrogen fixation NifU-like protein
MDALYREEILDLYQNPLNQGTIPQADASYEDANLLCGDSIHIDLLMDADQHIADIKWQGAGCAISQVCASLLTEEVKGMSLDEVRAFEKERLLEMLGTSLTGARVKCALLSLKVLKAAAWGVPSLPTPTPHSS